MAASNAALQVGTMSWSDLYPNSQGINPATSAPQTGAQASGGTGVSTSSGIGAAHWLIGGIVAFVAFRIMWEKQSIGA